MKLNGYWNKPEAIVSLATLRRSTTNSFLEPVATFEPATSLVSVVEPFDVVAEGEGVLRSSPLRYPFRLVEKDCDGL